MIYGIVYTSNTGFTKRYAQKLSEITQIPLYELNDKSLKKGSKVVYLGWLMAGQLKGYKKAKRKFDIVAVGAVSLGTGAEETKKANKITCPVYWLQGGMDHQKLTGIYKTMIDTLIRFLEKRNDESQKEMLNMIKADGDYYNEANLKEITEYIKKGKHFCLPSVC